MQKTKFQNEQKRSMREAKLGQSGYTKICKCGHLKDEHITKDKSIECAYPSCDCIIDFG